MKKNKSVLILLLSLSLHLGIATSSQAQQDWKVRRSTQDKQTYSLKHTTIKSLEQWHQLFLEEVKAGRAHGVKYLLEKGHEIVRKQNKELDLENNPHRLPVTLSSWVNTADERGYRALDYAVLLKRLHLFGSLIEAGASVNAAAPNGDNSLHLAISKGDLKTASILVEKFDADLELETESGLTPIANALLKNENEIATYLFKKGASLDIQMPGKKSLQDWAVENENTLVIDFLYPTAESLERPINDHEDTILHDVAIRNKPRLVKHLVKKRKASPTALNRSKQSPIYAAVIEGSSDGAVALVPYSKDFIKNDGKMLSHALMNEQWELAYELAQAGADIQTLVMVDPRDGRLESTRWLADDGVKLLQKRIEMAEKSLRELRKELHKARKSYYKRGLSDEELLEVGTKMGKLQGKHSEMSEYLKTQKKNLVWARRLERKLRHLRLEVVQRPEFIEAAKKGDLAIIKEGLLQRIPVDAVVDKDGFSALLEAAANGHLDVVQYLVDKGHANVHHRSKVGATALMQAAAHGHTEVVRFLLEKEARINDRNIYGYNSLILAAVAGHLETVQLLVNSKANVNSKTDTGHTALSIALQYRRQPVARYLICHKEQHRIPFLEIETTVSDGRWESWVQGVRRVCTAPQTVSPIPYRTSSSSRVVR